MVYNILFIATYPNQPNGYSKIANKLSNILVEIPNVKLYYFGFANFEESKINDRYINPNIEFIDVVKKERDLGNNELYGVNILEKVIIKIKPQLLFIYNDIIVVCRLINSIIEYRMKYFQNFKIYTYIDLVYDYERPEFLRHMYFNSEKIFVFSDYWKTHLKNMGFDDNKISVLYHGFNKDIFHKLDNLYAKKKIDIDENDFIILNANRNSYRKAQDITIASFLLFLKKNNFNRRIKLFLYCEMDSKNGYKIHSIIEVECIKLNLDYQKIINNHILHLKQLNVSDEIINTLYNACDIGINTCIGEGFGLCNMEHAILGKPQIVSNVGAFKDIFKNFDTTVKPSCNYQICNHTDEHNGTAYICKPEDFAEKLQNVYNNYLYYKELFEKESVNMINKYSWDSVKIILFEHINTLN